MQAPEQTPINDQLSKMLPNGRRLGEYKSAVYWAFKDPATRNLYSGVQVRDLAKQRLQMSAAVESSAVNLSDQDINSFVDRLGLQFGHFVAQSHDDVDVIRQLSSGVPTSNGYKWREYVDYVFLVDCLLDALREDRDLAPAMYTVAHRQTMRSLGVVAISTSQSAIDAREAAMKELAAPDDTFKRVLESIDKAHSDGPSETPNKPAPKRLEFLSDLVSEWTVMEKERVQMTLLSRLHQLAIIVRAFLDRDDQNRLVLECIQDASGGAENSKLTTRFVNLIFSAIVYDFGAIISMSLKTDKTQPTQGDLHRDLRVRDEKLALRSIPPTQRILSRLLWRTTIYMALKGSQVLETCLPFIVAAMNDYLDAQLQRKEHERMMEIQAAQSGIRGGRWVPIDPLMGQVAQASTSTVSVSESGDVGDGFGLEGGSGATEEPSVAGAVGGVNQELAGPVDPKDVQESIPEEVLSPEIRRSQRNPQPVKRQTSPPTAAPVTKRRKAPKKSKEVVQNSEDAGSDVQMGDSARMQPLDSSDVLKLLSKYIQNPQQLEEATRDFHHAGLIDHNRDKGGSRRTVTLRLPKPISVSSDSDIELTERPEPARNNDSNGAAQIRLTVYGTVKRSDGHYGLEKHSVDAPNLCRLTAPQGDYDRVRKFSEQVLKTYGGESGLLKEKPRGSIKIFSPHEFEAMTPVEKNAAIAAHTVVIKSGSPPDSAPGSELEKIRRCLDDLALHEDSKNREVFDTTLRPRDEDHLGCGSTCKLRMVQKEPPHPFRTMSLLDLYNEEGKLESLLNCLEIPVIDHPAPYGLDAATVGGYKSSLPVKSETYGLAGQKLVISRHHEDPDGVVTAITVLVGAKLWGVAMGDLECGPESTPYSLKANYLNAVDRFQNWNDKKCDMVLLEVGDTIVMGPSTLHFVLGAKTSLLVGSNMFLPSTWTSSLTNILTTHIHGQYVSNTAIVGMHLAIFYQLENFWLSAQKLQGPSVKVDFLRLQEKCEFPSDINLAALLVIVENSNRLTPLMAKGSPEQFPALFRHDHKLAKQTVELFLKFLDGNGIKEVWKLFRKIQGELDEVLREHREANPNLKLQPALSQVGDGLKSQFGDVPDLPERHFVVDETVPFEDRLYM